MSHASMALDGYPESDWNPDLESETGGPKRVREVITVLHTVCRSRLRGCVKPFAITLLAALTAPTALAFEVRPNPNLTGGSVRIDGHDISATCGHSKAYRGSMNHSRRDEILTLYGLPPGEHPDYEIDHLIPLCLGGSDDPSNLWPQPRRSIEPKWNAEAKDRLERRMCDLVCTGQLEIGAAQEVIAKDWIAAYHKYYEH